MTPINCRIFAQTSTCCGRVKFRAYLGSFSGRQVHVSIRHFTESEIRSGLSYLSKKFWIPVVIKDLSYQTQHTIAINKRSLYKRLTQAGIRKENIDYCVNLGRIDLLDLRLQTPKEFRWVSENVFYSHGPLL